VEKELLTLPEQLSSPRFLVGFLLLDLIFSFLCLAILIVVYPFSLAIVLSFDSRILITSLVSSASSYMKTITWCYSGSSRMGNIKYKDEMDLIYMLIDMTGIRNIREQDEPDIGIM
jgi:hypothetical protein